MIRRYDAKQMARLGPIGGIDNAALQPSARGPIGCEMLPAPPAPTVRAGYWLTRFGKGGV